MVTIFDLNAISSIRDYLIVHSNGHSIHIEGAVNECNEQAIPYALTIVERTIDGTTDYLAFTFKVWSRFLKRYIEVEADICGEPTWYGAAKSYIEAVEWELEQNGIDQYEAEQMNIARNMGVSI